MPKALIKGIVFVAAFAMVFLVSYAILLSFDLVPETSQQVSEQIKPALRTPVEVDRVEEPMRIVAKDIGLDATIVSPISKDIPTLDKALLSGAVRYPGTAALGTLGTMLLFGHSSYLPFIQNDAYKTFNDIQELEQGAVISVFSNEREYRYEVIRIEQAKATADRIALENNGRFLKLVTCNSFGAKEDRFVVTARLIGAYE